MSWLNDDDITRIVYDFLISKYTVKDMQNPKMYDEIIDSIRNNFDEETMMRYIDAGFHRPVSK